MSAIFTLGMVTATAGGEGEGSPVPTDGLVGPNPVAVIRRASPGIAGLPIEIGLKSAWVTEKMPGAWVSRVIASSCAASTRPLRAKLSGTVEGCCSVSVS